MRTEPLKTLGSLLAALPPSQKAKLIGCNPEMVIGRPTTLVEDLDPGGCFLAILGPNPQKNQLLDGHRHIDTAIARGAGLIIAQRNHASSCSPALAFMPHVLVEDSTALVPVLAPGWHGWPGDGLRLTGVTGTSGKGSVCHLVAAGLAAAGRSHLRLGTTGNWLVDHEEPASYTTPPPFALQTWLARAVAAGATDAVMEVSSFALAQRRVATLTFRAVALVSFDPNHLDFHSDVDAYLEAKCRLAREACATDGIAVAPLEQGRASDAFLRAAADAGVGLRWRTSRTPAPGADLCVLEHHPGPGLAARIQTPLGLLDVRSPLFGPFNLDNLLVAIALGIGHGLELEPIAEGLAHAPAVPGRLEPVIVPESDGPAVYVDYAQTPNALSRVLEALRPQVDAGGKLIVLLGCDGEYDPFRRTPMGEAASRGADLVVATSVNPRGEDPLAIIEQICSGALPPSCGGAELRREVDRAVAIASTIAEANVADVIVLVGKGHEVIQEMDGYTIPFSDHEHASRALRARLGQ